MQTIPCEFSFFIISKVLLPSAAGKIIKLFYDKEINSIFSSDHCSEKKKKKIRSKALPVDNAGRSDLKTSDYQ